MKSIITIFTAFALFTGLFAQETDPNAYTKTGDKVPAFELKTLDGKTVNTEDLKGKVLYINFFTLSCPPCMREMPEIEAEIWKGIKSENFVMLAIGREHTKEQLQKWAKKKGLTLPIAADTDRSVYKNFAKQMVPRHYIIDKTGKIIYQHQGYNKKEFEKMIKKIKKAL